MKQTEHYKLNKPDPTDYINVEDFNENADKIDAELKKKTDKTYVDESIANNKPDLTPVENMINEHKANDNKIKHKANQVSLADNNFTATDVEAGMGELFTNVSDGKNLVGGAITGVDDSVVIPTDPTFGDLADGIGQISTGKKWASGRKQTVRDYRAVQYLDGTTTAPSYFLEVLGLSFLPKFIYIYWQQSQSVTGITLYTDIPDQPYQKTVKHAREAFNQSYSTQRASHFKGDVSPVNVNNGGFYLPTGYNGVVDWVAFE